MWTVHSYSLQDGINHVSLPLGAEALAVGRTPWGLHVCCRQLYMPPTFENRIFLVVSDDKVELGAALGSKWRHVGSVFSEENHLHRHVFELVPDRVVGTKYGYGE